MNNHFHLGLLHLTHLFMGADGNVTEDEMMAVEKVKEVENISQHTFEEFESSIKSLNDRDIYDQGMRHINLCTRDEKIKAFAVLYRLAEADGEVHLAEIRLLLHAIAVAGIEFDEVVNAAKSSNHLS